MVKQIPLASIVALSLLACAEVPTEVPSGPIARFGKTPTIDGVFEEGEWDDASVVRTDSVEHFRMKHDSVNIYFAIKAGGGDLWLNTATGLRVLHWSAQLGNAIYTSLDSSRQLLQEPYDYELWALQEQPATVIRESLDTYLDEHGWAANIAPLGELMESELAVSLDWLGVKADGDRFVEIPGVRIGGGLMIARGDPRGEELMAMPREEVRRRYPPVFWPNETVPNDSISRGVCPDTIEVNYEAFGRIWIDLEK